MATRPSAVSRAAKLPILLPAFLRSHSIAFSMSPPASVSAVLHSIIGALVRSRSDLTSLAEMAMVFSSLCKAACGLALAENRLIEWCFFASAKPHAAPVSRNDRRRGLGVRASAAACRLGRQRRPAFVDRVGQLRQ